MKYELFKESPSDKLYRIRALKPIRATGHNRFINRGDVGGYVEGEHNLNQDGQCWIFDNAKVYGNAFVDDYASVGGNAEVYGNAQILTYAKVYGNAKVYDRAKVYGNAKVYGHSVVRGNANIDGFAEVYDKAEVYDRAQIKSTAKVYGNAKICGTAEIMGGDEVSSGKITAPRSDETEKKILEILKQYNKVSLNLFRSATKEETYKIHYFGRKNDLDGLSQKIEKLGLKFTIFDDGIGGEILIRRHD